MSLSHRRQGCLQLLVSFIAYLLSFVLTHIQTFSHIKPEKNHLKQKKIICGDWMVGISINEPKDAAARNIAAVGAVISSASFLLEIPRISFSSRWICDKKTKNLLFGGFVCLFVFHLLYLKSALAQHSVTPLSLRATATFSLLESFMAEMKMLRLLQHLLKLRKRNS